MTNRKTILSELNDLGSALGNYSPQNIYAVPTGYFEGLPTRILNRIKALEAESAKEELEFLSPMLSSLSKEMPYSVPVGFFQNLSDSVLQGIKENANHQTSAEEIERISPLLSSLKNKNPYSVPAGYFEKLESSAVAQESLNDNQQTKIVSITRRTWYRLAVAAVFIGVIALGAWLFNGPRQPDINKNPQAWINKNVSKKVSEEKIDEFVKLAEDETITSVKENDAIKEAEIKELMKDVSEKEIEDFLNDAVALESKDTDALMN